MRARMALAGLAGLTLAGAAIRPRERLLLEPLTHGIPIPKSASLDFHGCCWSGPHELLVAARNDYAEFTRPYRLDLRTGALRRLPALERALKAQGPLANSFDWRYSPDGRWLLRTDWVTEHSFRWVATLVDGRCPPRIFGPVPFDEMGEAYWSADGQGFAVATYCREPANFVGAYSLDRPVAVDSRRAPRLDAYSVPLGVAGSSVLYADYVFRHEGEKVPLALVPEQPSGSVVRSEAEVPGGGDAMQIVVSPTGDRLAWRVELDPEKSPSRLARWLDRLLHVHRRRLMAIYLTNLDGTCAHELGHVDFEPMRIVIDGWSPDGRMLLIEDRDRLYTVPTD